MLYELVLQRPMFSGDVFEVFAKAREADFEAPEDVNRDLPPKLYEILHKALARDPEMRYQSGGDMLADLDECMAELACRPNERSLSIYLKDILRVEANDEMTAMQEAAQSKSIAESSHTITPGRDISLQKTIALPKEELERRSEKRIGFFYPLATVAVVILVFILGLQYFKDPVSRINAVISSLYKRDVTSDITQTQTALPNSTEPGDTYLKSVREAEALLQTEHFEEAVSLYGELLTKEPGIKDRIAVSYSNALLGLAQKAPETDSVKARDMAFKALEISPDNIDGYLWLGLYYTKEKNFSKAIEFYEKAVSLDPNAPKAYFNLGYVFAESKNYLKAEEMYMNAVRLSPPFLDEALCNLAIIQRRLGKKDQSIKNFREALRVNPNNEVAKKYLERIK
jgi:tetratricopeptide (TPR) repeat protein